MKLIVGLGNPGEKYERTRHNIGFMVLERFLKDFSPVGKTQWSDEPTLKSDVVELEWQRRSSRGSSGQARLEKVVLAKPKTYMNNSGMAVNLLLIAYGLQSADIWIVHDEIDLPLGYMKIRFGGASAGHHGIESIMESLGTDKFWRFRMGIGAALHNREEVAKHKHKNVEDYVLSNFTGKERSKIKDLVKRGSKAIQMGLEEGLEVSQNRFNTK